MNNRIRLFSLTTYSTKIVDDRRWVDLWTSVDKEGVIHTLPLVFVGLFELMG